MKLSITVTGDTVEVIRRAVTRYQYGGKASVLLMTALVSHLHREHQREIDAVALEITEYDPASNEHDIDYSTPDEPVTIDNTPDALAERNEELKGQLGNVTKVPEGTLAQDTAAAREALTQGATTEPPDEDGVF